jgi:hypothetical protein
LGLDDELDELMEEIWYVAHYKIMGMYG